MEILFDCNDRTTQRSISRVVRYMLCQLKEVEREMIENEEMETIEYEEENEKGEMEKVTDQRPKAVSLQFLKLLLNNLHKRAARAWRKFECYLEIFFSFAVHSADDIEKDSDNFKSAPFDASGVAYKTGVEYFFKKNYLTLFADYILQEDSPCY